MGESGESANLNRSKSPSRACVRACARACVHLKSKLDTDLKPESPVFCTDGGKSRRARLTAITALTFK